MLQISKMFWGVHPHTRDHCYPPLISYDKWGLICFNSLCFFSFIYFKYKYSWMLRMQEMTFQGFKFQKFSAWYIGHTRGPQPLLSPSNILSHRKVPFQKMPHGKILKKGSGLCGMQVAWYWYFFLNDDCEISLALNIYVNHRKIHFRGGCWVFFIHGAIKSSDGRYHQYRFDTIPITFS
jgi:hypothetical protein